jgi:hypothetical protein
MEYISKDSSQRGFIPVRTGQIVSIPLADLEAFNKMCNEAVIVAAVEHGVIGRVYCKSCGDDVTCLIGDGQYGGCATCHAFETVTAPLSQCQCIQCLRDRDERNPGIPTLPMETARMTLCANCGNKRCPRATNHRNECTNSNKPGQHGSIYEDY